MEYLDFIERFNSENVNYILQLTPQLLFKKLNVGDNLTNNNNFDDLINFSNYSSQIMNFLKYVKSQDYKVTSSYKQKDNQGRFYVKNFGIQRMDRILRGFVCKNLNDYDIVNCHPTLLLNIIKNHDPNYDVTYLKNYIDHRDEILISNNLSKLEILKCINSDRNANKNLWLNNFHKSLKNIKEQLYNKNISLLSPDKKHNKISSVVNKLICIEENKILEKVVTNQISKKIEISVLMLDGFMTESSVNIDELNALCIQENVKWIHKPHNSEFCENDENDENNKSYEYIKKEFEKTHFIVKNPLTYCEVETENGEEYIYKKNKMDFLNTYESKFFEKEQWNPKTKTYDTVEKPFCVQWLKDSTARKYNKFVLLPPPHVCSDNVYNLFTGFKYESIEEEADDDINIFLDHIKLLAGDDQQEECTEYIINYLAHLIQFAGVLPEVSILLKSVQGIGKNLFFESFGNHIIGNKYMLSTANSDYIVGRFNQINSKFLVLYDEASGADTFKTASKIKEMITQPEITWEDKGLSAIKLNNYMRLLFFSNSETPVKIESSDRRFQVIECSTNKPDTDYFDALFKAFQNKAKVKGFAQYLKNIDLSDYKPKNKRVFTAQYEVLKSKNLTIYDKYFKEMVYKNKITFDEKIQSIELYHQFEKYCEKKEYSPPSNKAFSMKIMKYNSVEKKRNNKYTSYIIKFKPFINEMKTNNIIDDDEYDYIINQYECLIED